MVLSNTKVDHNGIRINIRHVDVCGGSDCRWNKDVIVGDSSGTAGAADLAAVSASPLGARLQTNDGSLAIPSAETRLRRTASCRCFLYYILNHSSLSCPLSRLKHCALRCCILPLSIAGTNLGGQLDELHAS